MPTPTVGTTASPQRPWFFSMHPSPKPDDLQDLIASCNQRFRAHLLDHTPSDRQAAFEDFVDVAEQIIRETPDVAAVHLAGLLALRTQGHQRPDLPIPRRRARSIRRHPTWAALRPDVSHEAAL